MVNYGNSVIYKLCCKDTNITDFYIGSTTNFSRRKAEHKRKCNDENNKEYNQYKYQFIRDNDGFQNWDMILIENISCNNKRELEQIERKYIDELKPSLNSNKSYRTKDEKKEYHKEYNKEYNQNNKEYLKKLHKEKYEKNKTVISEKRKEKVECEFCNCLVRKDGIKEHQKSLKCMKFQFIED